MPYRTRIKMCGTTRAADAEAAVAAGIDCLGFIFAEKSPRYITPQQAARIIGHLPPFVSRVGVFVDETCENLVETASRANLTGLQLHGGESAALCKAVRRELPSLFVMKAFRIGEKSRKEDFWPYEDVVDGFLLDTYVKGVEGGTGAVFDWRIIEDLELKKPVILAGGLQPDNVGDALGAARPYAVDVNSGVEISPGRKDETLVRLFVQKVAQFDQMQRAGVSGRR